MVSIEGSRSKAITAEPLRRKDSTHAFPIPEAGCPDVAVARRGNPFVARRRGRAVDDEIDANLGRSGDRHHGCHAKGQGGGEGEGAFHVSLLGEHVELTIATAFRVQEN